MATDISRARFDPRQDYSGVLLQQGRVLLDADWNELVSLLGRRSRAAAADLGSSGPGPGTAGVAVVPRTTPDGFAVTVTGGDLTIGAGRMYVDGILAENHGFGATSWDPLLAEPRSTLPTPYLEQPYWPTPDPPPANGAHVVYIDVWERELTALERPDLVEVAVGVDSTARTQVAWQVRVMPDDATGVDCSTKDADVPGWSELTAPSGGRLTTDTVPVVATEDPCTLPPTGGYRGLENQTYRVEIHDPGPAGTATFKWSRDNGTVASPVEEVSALQIRPSSLGKDDVLRFHTGDWVEVIDDHRELNHEPGDLRRVEVHDDQGTMTLASALSPDLVMNQAAARSRHLRVRRWDQNGEVRRVDGTLVVDLSASAEGVIPIPADGVAIVLEHGLTVRLRAAGGTFHQGDYWVFAARTSGTSVEQLTDAPPLGTHHHYARLGVFNFPDTAEGEGDCRVLWPPERADACGDCTVCVTPQSHADGTLTIQDAVDSVREDGGTICLAGGVYRLDEPVTLDGADQVRIRGQGPRTALIAAAGAMTIVGSSDVTVERLGILSGAGSPAILLDTAKYATLRRLRIAADYDTPRAGGGELVPAVTMRGTSLGVRVHQCEVYGPVGIGTEPGGDGGLLTAELHVSECGIFGRESGLRFDAETLHAGGNSVRDNVVSGGSDGTILALGSVAPDGSFDVTGNTILTRGYGIVVAASGYRVDGNHVSGHIAWGDSEADGIVVSPEASTEVRGAVRICGNEVRDMGGSGIACRAPVKDLRIEHNLVERTDDGITVTDRGGATTASVVHNVVRDVVRRASESSDHVGIQVIRARTATVSQNVVDGVALDVQPQFDLAGIRVLGVVEAHVCDNTVTNIGNDEVGVMITGIEVASPFLRVHVEGNISRQSDGPVEAMPSMAWSGLVVGAVDTQPEFRTHGRVFTVEGRRTASVGPRFAFATASTGDRTDVSAVIDANTVTGGGRTPAAVVRVDGDVTVSANQCRLAPDAKTPALRVAARTATIQGNRARFGFPSIQVGVPIDALAAVGNVTTQGIEDEAGSPLPPPWDQLNPVGV